ncbi:MAG TPA: ABC transporter substrate-binding protein [Mycobacterium sp.]|nr:ABC transporter substrate-binding protein [Mycobacterium sp.]
MAAGLPTACSRTEGDRDGQPVTIKHLFGETVITTPPTRVVSAGYTEQDDLLALGVIPVAVTSWFGDQPFAVWPWAQPQLGAATPVVLNLDGGIEVDRIADCAPDLIVATNAGVDADTYARLTEIAPTVPQTGPDAFFGPWKDQAQTIGRAVFAADRMRSLIEGVDQQFTAVTDRFPQFAGRTALLLDGRLSAGEAVATRSGWQTDFLTRMGLAVAGLDEFAGNGRAVIPRDRLQPVLEGADVVIWTTDNDAEQDALRADPDLAALRTGQVFTTGEQAGAIAFASPLSYPVVAEQLPPLIATALS